MRRALFAALKSVLSCLDRPNMPNACVWNPVIQHLYISMFYGCYNHDLSRAQPGHIMQ